MKQHCASFFRKKAAANGGLLRGEVDRGGGLKCHISTRLAAAGYGCFSSVSPAFHHGLVRVTEKRQKCTVHRKRHGQQPESR